MFYSWTQILHHHVSLKWLHIIVFLLRSFPSWEEPAWAARTPFSLSFALVFHPFQWSCSLPTVHTHTWSKLMVQDAGGRGLCRTVGNVRSVQVPVSLFVVTIYCIFYFFCYSFANLSKGPKVWHNYFSLHYLFMMLLSLSFIHSGL